VEILKHKSPKASTPPKKHRSDKLGKNLSTTNKRIDAI
jgi:hypothetical protein